MVQILKSFSLFFFFAFFSVTQGLAAEKRYDLRIQKIAVNFTGKSVDHALGIAQTFPAPKEAAIPAPVLKFRLGDKAVIKATNDTDEPVTLHWHGVLVPWRQDGPQFVNTKIIEPNESHTFSFPIRHTGTYWYHSHTELQEQRGLYGAIVIEEDEPIEEVDHDYIIVMSDWIDEAPKTVLYNLKKDGHYYSLKKGFAPTLWGAVKKRKFREYLKGEWTRMGPMDLGDVGYDAYLINGKTKSTFKGVRHGEKVRFRLINAAASTYFYFNIGNYRNFKVITKDGMPVEPVEVNELFLGVAETYDIIFEVPHIMKAFEARATAQDITGSASLIFGTGEMEMVPHKIKPSPYGMDHNSMDHNDMDHNDMDHGKKTSDNDNGHEGHSMPPEPPSGEKTIKRLRYEMLRSTEPSRFDDNLLRAKTIDLELSGDMERYTWHINGKPFSEDKYIEIRENEVITFRLINTTMMHHPMHLHGHFFRVFNGQGDYLPLFHTVDVAPMKTVTIEFHANEPGIWFLHCHNLYHMKMGMSRLVKYEGFEPPEELKADQAKWGSMMTKDDSAFKKVETAIYSNMAEINVGVNAGRYEIDIEVEAHEYDFDHDLEAEVIFKKYIGKFLAVGAGSIVDDQKVYAALMTAYTLPGLIEMHNYLRHDGKVITKLHKSIPLAVVLGKTLSLDLEPKLEYKDQFEWKFKSELLYIYSEKISFGLSYGRKEEKGRFFGFGIRLKF